MPLQGMRNLGTGASDACAGDDARLSDARTPSDHGVDKHTDVTRELFVPAYGDGTASPAGVYTYTTQEFADGTTQYTRLSFKVPDDFVSLVSVKAIWMTPGEESDMSWGVTARYGAAGESVSAHSDSPAKGVTTSLGDLTWNVQEPPNPLTLANLAEGDYVGLQFTRYGGDTEDTLGAVANLLGFLFTYVAEQ